MTGGWPRASRADGLVALDPLIARARRIERELPDLLAKLEKLEIREVRPRRRRGALDDVASDLGIVSAGQSGTDVPGSIYITLQLAAERSGGFVADTGDALASWLGQFLNEPKQKDVRDKLASSPARALRRGMPLSICPGSRRPHSPQAISSCATERRCQ